MKYFINSPYTSNTLRREYYSLCKKLHPDRGGNAEKFKEMMNEYDRGYYDALKWVYEHTYGDNYKLQVKDKMQEFIKE